MPRKVLQIALALVFGLSAAIAFAGSPLVLNHFRPLTGYGQDSPLPVNWLRFSQASVRTIVAWLARGVVFADDFRGRRTCSPSLSRLS
jgi:hypothetical protein